MDINKKWKNLTKNSFLSDYFIIIFFPIVLSWHFHGGNALRLIVISVLAALGLEALFNNVVYRYAFKRIRKNDLPLAAYMGICTAMALPASAPFWFPIVGLIFAYLITGLFVPLLSKKQAMFSRLHIMPAAAALTFLSFFHKILFTYTPVLAEASEDALAEVVALPSLANMLSEGVFSAEGMYTAGDILTGAVTGPLGTGCVVVILAALVFLFLRRPIFALAPSSFILLSIVWAFLFPRQDLGRFTSIGYELSAGMLLFAAVFLLSFPKYLPRKNMHKLIYGALTALLTMILRRILPIEETVFIAMFIMNFSLLFFNKNVKTTARVRRVAKEQPDRQVNKDKADDWKDLI